MSARALLLALALLAPACANPSQAPSAAPVVHVPPGWSRMRPMLAHAEGLAATGDTAGLTALVPALQHEGLSLLKANVPNTLPRHEMPRFLEARAAFGDALVRVAEAREQGRPADLPALVRALAGAWRGWMAVITGTSPEKAV